MSARSTPTGTGRWRRAVPPRRRDDVTTPPKAPNKANSDSKQSMEAQELKSETAGRMGGNKAKVPRQRRGEVGRWRPPTFPGRQKVDGPFRSPSALSDDLLAGCGQNALKRGQKGDFFGNRLCGS